MNFLVIAQLWAAFVDRERGRFEFEVNNRFGIAFSHVNRYLTLMRIISARHHATFAEFREAERAETDALAARMRGQPLNAGPFHDRRRELGWQLQLDVESFYMFARILLGRVANAIEYYFGQGRRASLNSHHQLTNNLEEY